MNPTLWGPVTWQVLLACAWNCKLDAMDRLNELLRLIPLLLPCEKCRAQHVKHLSMVNRRANGPPTKPQDAFRWIWTCKALVNKSLGQSTTSLNTITERFMFHGAVVDDILLGDSLVLFALTAKRLMMEEEFLQMCEHLSVLLPLPHDSELIIMLAQASFPIVPFAVKAAKAARIERGSRPLSLKHYEEAN